MPSNSLGARLRRIAPPKNPFVAAIDFDHTIHNNDDVEEGFKMGRPHDGAREVLRQLQESGARIVIHTCRARPGKDTVDGVTYEGSSAHHVEEWLRHYDIPFDEVTALKPIAGVYLDNNAMRFEGSWDAIATELLAMAYRHQWGRPKK